MKKSRFLLLAVFMLLMSMFFAVSANADSDVRITDAHVTAIYEDGVHIGYSNVDHINGMDVRIITGDAAASDITVLYPNEEGVTLHGFESEKYYKITITPYIWQSGKGLESNEIEFFTYKEDTRVKNVEQVSAAETSAGLRWDPVPNVSSYEVVYNSEDGGKGTKRVTGTETTIPITGFVNTVSISPIFKATGYEEPGRYSNGGYILGQPKAPTNIRQTDDFQLHYQNSTDSTDLKGIEFLKPEIYFSTSKEGPYELYTGTYIYFDQAALPYLERGTHYYIKIRSVATNLSLDKKFTVYGEFSEIGELITPGTKTPVSSGATGSQNTSDGSDSAGSTGITDQNSSNAVTVAAVKNVTVKSAKKAINLRWKKVKGATSYTVYISNKPKKGFKKAGTTKGLKMNVKKFGKKKLVKKKTYYVKVVANKEKNGVVYTSKTAKVYKIRVK